MNEQQPSDQPQQATVSSVAMAMFDLARSAGFPNATIDRGNGELVEVANGESGWRSFTAWGEPRDQLIALGHLAQTIVQALPVPQATSPLAALTLPPGVLRRPQPPIP